MADVIGRRLWLGENGAVVCELAECCGQPMLDTLVRLPRLPNQVTGKGDVLYHRMTPADLAELATLLQSQGKELSCDGAHVVYDVPSKQLWMKVTT